MEFVLDNKLSFVYTDLLDWQLSLAENRRGWRSLLSIVSLSLGDLTRDAWVVRDVTGLRLVESVACCSHELSLVGRAAVANHDLRGVLVGHHECGAVHSVSVGMWVVSLQGLLLHAGVQGWPRLENI